MTNQPAPAHARADLLAHFECVLTRSLANLNLNSSLQAAMTYTSLNGGKRIRALLVYASGLSFGANLAQLDDLAIAVELIHAYSLIHDDLPAMDNADLRRGKPACHKAFDEATAILAGDALQALAFHIIAQANYLSFRQQQSLLQCLSEAALRMVDGQMLDLKASQATSVDLATITQIHQGKTAALIKASVLLGAYAANATAEQINQLTIYAEQLGLAFQIYDDILDIESSTEKLGKPAQLDQQSNKLTYPAVCGLPAAKQAIADLYREAITALEKLEISCELLYELANYMIEREY